MLVQPLLLPLLFLPAKEGTQATEKTHSILQIGTAQALQRDRPARDLEIAACFALHEQRLLDQKLARACKVSARVLIGFEAAQESTSNAQPILTTILIGSLRFFEF